MIIARETGGCVIAAIQRGVIVIVLSALLHLGNHVVLYIIVYVREEKIFIFLL